MATPYTSESDASVTGEVSSKGKSRSGVSTPFTTLTTHVGDKGETVVDMDQPLPHTVVESVASTIELYGG
ncbi:hypothetical protein TELCIR_15982 [Teladorsagia circumcincta]|uniref:Uncharacterized protein n=1 Tax=Teladorsagia circumcincta TaxID=45464 RepID=A0A2G9TWV5_TELCI|nr:hypothetical protein TELCIR_15982 [Teladorsagia circumcincta]